MIIISVLIDTNIFVSYYNKRDVEHERASKIMPEIFDGRFGKPIVSDYIFDEIITVCLARLKDKEHVKKIGSDMLSTDIIFVKVSENVFSEAWKFFLSTDKTFSFTDCTNIALLKIYNIDSIATFDSEFKKVKDVKVVP
ncbi:MAG: type II toxin-antitoxin system VapC family toxin [Candidatus Aenigmarchaeota archaeon]|nr:type II toxin-antitoxin system VapC family toxin [Candidatus Aenigmarchaeota archaeon]